MNLLGKYVFFHFWIFWMSPPSISKPLRKLTWKMQKVPLKKTLQQRALSSFAAAPLWRSTCSDFVQGRSCPSTSARANCMWNTCVLEPRKEHIRFVFSRFSFFFSVLLSQSSTLFGLCELVGQCFTRFPRNKRDFGVGPRLSHIHTCRKHIR